MKQMHLSNDTYEALENIAWKNFRTVELQIAYWLAQEGHTKTSIAKKHVSGKTRGWSDEKRAEQSQRMKEMWLKGQLKPRRTDLLDAAAGGKFDD